jgi:hypothetical protein
MASTQKLKELDREIQKSFHAPPFDTGFKYTRRQRETRDIQFEMSQFQVQSQLLHHRQKLNNKAVDEGISKFENNLIRLGIGAAAESRAKYGKIISEDLNVFENRLESTYRVNAQKKNQEAKEIFQDIKHRVVSNRIARLEKMKRVNRES